jgi:Cys-tRNA(Pro)/Cys-tRNA(Cys) deacylase
MQKTLAMKLLEGKGVPYEVMQYPRDQRDAEAIASIFGLPAGQVLKTLVVPSPKGAPRSVKDMLIMIPADCQLDLKKLAKAVKVKKLKMATHAEAERLTGLEVGGISALALLNRGFSVFLDASAASFDQVLVSAGHRGLNIKLPLADLQRLTNARNVDVCSR